MQVTSKSTVNQPPSDFQPLRGGLFMISCAARTGSSMLVNLLQSHPQITCHMEIFGPRKVEGFWGRYRELLKDAAYEERMRAYRSAHPAAYLYKIAFDSQSRSHVGFKFKHEEFLLPMFAEVRTLIGRDDDIKIINLHRRNLMRRYLSWWVANHVTGVTMKVEGEAISRYDPVVMDPKSCLEDFESTERRAELVATMLPNHRSLNVYYEDLVGPNAESVSQDIQAFLGVEPRQLKTVFAKLAHNQLRADIANVDELKEAFAGTKYAGFFEE